MKHLILFAALLLPFTASATGVYETVFVPDNKKLVLLPKNVESCISVKVVKLRLPRTEFADENDYSVCGKLVVSPTRLPDYCFDD